MSEHRMDCFCGGKDHAKPSRREFLYVGLVGGIGLTLPEYFHLQARAGQAAASNAAPAKSVIHIFLPGGISGQESFDPKPYAPIEYRGPFGTVKTKLDGVLFSEHMKQTAQIADKLTIIRSMTHGEAAHERGTHNMFTGYRPSPALQYPSMGSVVAHELGANGELPPYVAIPTQPNPFAGTGYLSTRYGPFSLGADPANNNFQVRDLSLPGGVDDHRFYRRQRLLDVVDTHFRNMENADVLDAMDEFYMQAYTMISSQQAREAFNLAAEPEELRNQYGRNQAGQRMLLARRLAEAGVRFVSMVFGGWDHHENIRQGVERQLPQFDQAFATLIRDLEQRGTLDDTLVLVTTEFGRTPRINADAGRDHFPRVFSIAMAGGGVKKGMVYGASDATSTSVADNPMTVEAFAATVYNQLGVDYTKRLMAPGDRPVDIVNNGRIVQAILERSGRPA